MAAKLITANLASVIGEVASRHHLLEPAGGPAARREVRRALRAEVRDPLWMLTRQWQMGEFRGDDAGSPIFAKVRIETTRLRKYQAERRPVEPFDDAVPLEARVERMPMRVRAGRRTSMSLDIRLLMGRSG